MVSARGVAQGCRQPRAELGRSPRRRTGPGVRPGRVLGRASLMGSAQGRVRGGPGLWFCLVDHAEWWATVAVLAVARSVSASASAPLLHCALSFCTPAPKPLNPWPLGSAPLASAPCTPGLCTLHPWPLRPCTMLLLLALCWALPLPARSLEEALSWDSSSEQVSWGLGTPRSLLWALHSCRSALTLVRPGPREGGCTPVPAPVRSPGLWVARGAPQAPSILALMLLLLFAP